MRKTRTGPVVALAAAVLAAATAAVAAGQLAPADRPGARVPGVAPLTVESATGDGSGEPTDAARESDALDSSTPRADDPASASEPSPGVPQDPATDAGGGATASETDVVAVSPPAAEEVHTPTAGRPDSPGKSDEHKPESTGRPSP